MTPITPAQALAAAAIVATRAATMPHLNRLADALTDHADETARPCQDCPFRKDCPDCQWQGDTDDDALWTPGESRFGDEHDNPAGASR
jgi:hypothetical protein